MLYDYNGVLINSYSLSVYTPALMGVRKEVLQLLINTLHTSAYSYNIVCYKLCIKCLYAA